MPHPLNLRVVHLEDKDFFLGKCWACQKFDNDDTEKRVADCRKMGDMGKMLDDAGETNLNICVKHIQWLQKMSIARMKAFGVDIQKFQAMKEEEVDKFIVEANEKSKAYLEECGAVGQCGMCVKEKFDLDDKLTANITKLTKLFELKDTGLPYKIREHFNIPGGGDLFICKDHYQIVSNWLAGELIKGMGL